MNRGVVFLYFFIFMLCGVETSAVAKSSIFAVSPTGQPDMVFKNTSLADAMSKLTNICMDHGLPVNNPSNNELTCEVHLGVIKAALSQTLLGNNYSTTPQEFFKFHFSQIGDATRVQAMAWIETQMAFGQLRRAPLKSDAIYNELMGVMMRAGADFLVGTKFPNYPYLGAQFDNMKALDIPHYKWGCPINELKDDSPLRDAGIMVGDIIVEINGNTFKNITDFAHILNKIDNGKKVALKFLRDGNIQSVNIIASERQPIQS